ncbi:Protein CPR-5 [Vitis vinifera]|uniref:Protein CPR-5 n=1 Tax=Vitis vinifera TaxID=29760 RepID=A0A438KJS6_VITVI|nr:Protein CPR-5 [Vitis vinifera]
MDTPLHSLQTLESSVCGSTEESSDADLVDTISVDSIISHANPTVQFPPPTSASTTTASKLINMEKKKKKKKRALVDVSAPSSSSNSMYVRVGNKRRNPRILMGLNRRSESEAEAIALPLGMSIAAIVSQILKEKMKQGKGCLLIIFQWYSSNPSLRSVRWNLAFHKWVYAAIDLHYGCQRIFSQCLKPMNISFVSNMCQQFLETSLIVCEELEKSFGSTLRTLRLINESPLNKVGGHLSHFNVQNSGSDLNLPVPLNRGDTISSSSISDHHSSMDSANRELTVHGQISQQLACVSSSSLGSVMNRSTVSTFEKSVVEQARSNDLKALELSLSMKKMKLKETQLALNSDSYLLERMKFSMGISKASFKAEKFKNQLEDTKHAELLRKCIDCLVAGVQVLVDPKANGIFEFRVLHTQVSASSKQTMPVTFIILLLGVVCGVAGKFCVDTLGGSGYHWLLYWEALCLLHFVSNICTSALFLLLHGPITVSQGAKGNTMIPYWIRRTLFYAAILLFLPLLCGLMPFASPGYCFALESRNLAPTLCQAVCLMYSAEVGLAA